MNMHEKIAVIQDILLEGNSLALSLENDKNYTQEARARAGQRARAEHLARAKSVAAVALRVAASARETAHQQLIDARRQVEATTDYSRTLAGQREAEALALAGWDAIKSEIADASTLADQYKLRSYAAITLPQLLAKAHKEEAGPWRARAGQIESLGRQIAERLADLEPEQVKEARSLADAAEADERQLRNDLARLNDRYAQRVGGPGPLREDIESTEIEYHDTSGVIKRFTAPASSIF
jgi:multidrug efflux pump subunit AcrA (membrane-fusion protein)